MSDVEMVTQRNWEQRRHAEEYAAQLKDNKVIRLDRIATAPAEPRNDGKIMKRNKSGMAKAAKAVGRIAMVMSAASAFAGMELLFPLFLTVAVIFYALHFELKGRCGAWHKMI